MNAKRRKVDTECQNFQDTWTLYYFFIKHAGKPVCLICLKNVAVKKVANIKQHYETRHSGNFSKFTEQVRKDEAE